MPAPETNLFDPCQARFHQRWQHLNDPHVRALAWLLDAPDLLDPQAPQWRGLIATLAGVPDQQSSDWLAVLDVAPQALHAYLDIGPYTRLGHYAEKLMAFYFQHQGALFAHGIQVRSDKNHTVGEFDFLLRQGDALLHWEFATKFYLLEPSGDAQEVDSFVGPNLADTLGAKMRKILERQLSLAQHPAAQIHLPQAIAAAQALVKGWLFYHADAPHATPSAGVSAAHCRGFWCAWSELQYEQDVRYAILPRLSWLAPAKVGFEQALSRQQWLESLQTHFARDAMPVLVAELAEHDGWMIEMRRGFVVPDDWRSRASERVQK